MGAQISVRMLANETLQTAYHGPNRVTAAGQRADRQPGGRGAQTEGTSASTASALTMALTRLIRINGAGLPSCLEELGDRGAERCAAGTGAHRHSCMAGREPDPPEDEHCQGWPERHQQQARGEADGDHPA